MLDTSSSGKEVKQAEAAPQFTAFPPQLNPLAASSPIAVTMCVGGVTIDPLNDLSHSDLVRGSGTITDRMITRSEREVFRRPQSSRAHANLGIALLNAGDLELAEKEFETALSLEPRHYVASMNLARVRTEQGRFEETEKIYSDLAHHYPKDPTPLLSLAYIAIRKGENESAARLLRDAINLGHKAITAKHLLGLVLLKLGNNREAISILRSATHVAVREPALYEALGVAYSVAGQYRRATIAFKTALSLTPWARNAALGLAQSFLFLKQSDDATELLIAYLERHPRDNEAKRLLATAYTSRRQYRSANAQLIQIWGDFEQSRNDDTLLKVDVANNIGANYFKNREFPQAEQWFLRSIATGPNLTATPYANLARVCLYNRDIERAVDILRHARGRFGDDPDLLMLMASCLINVGSYNEAVVLLRPIYETGKATPEIYGQLSHCLFEGAGDREAALKIAQEGYTKFPDKTIVANNLAYLYLILGDAHSARPILEASHIETDESEYNPVNEVCLTATWGLLSIVEGDLAEGNRLYKKAHKLAKQFGNKELENSVMQKLHLELARAYNRLREYEAAGQQVRQGLAIRDGNLHYEQQLQEFHKHLLLLNDGGAPQ